jgi:hypothetical protein
LQHHAHIQINETTPSQPVTQETTAHGGDTLLFTHHQPNGCGIGRQEIKNRMQKLLPCKKTRQKWSFTFMRSSHVRNAVKTTAPLFSFFYTELRKLETPQAI